MGNQNLNDRPQLEFPLDNELRTPVEDGREMPEVPMKSKVYGVLNSRPQLDPLGEKRVEDAQVRRPRDGSGESLMRVSSRKRRQRDLVLEATQLLRAADRRQRPVVERAPPPCGCLRGQNFKGCQAQRSASGISDKRTRPHGPSGTPHIR